MDPLSSEPREAALIAGLREREEASVAELLDRYWPSAYRLALAICGDPAGAEDVAQEAFVRALQGIDGFDSNAALRPWLMRIVTNLARNSLRAEARRSAREEAVARPEATALQPSRQAERSEAAQQVRAILGSLAPPLREALALRYLDELSLAEVASTLGCPQGTVSSRIRRGLARLRERLEGGLVPAPLTGLGAVGALTLLRGVLAPPAAGAAEVLRQAASLTARPELYAAPAGALAAAAGAGAGLSPPPPSPSELLEASRSLAATAAGASKLAPWLLALATLSLSAGGAGLLLSEPADSPRPSGLASLHAPQPTSSPATRSPGAPAPGLELAFGLELPPALTRGDRVLGGVRASWKNTPGSYLGEDLSLEASLRAGASSLALTQGPPRAAGGAAVEWPLHLDAREPGPALLEVVVRRRGAVVFRESRAIEVAGGLRPVELVQNVQLEGPEGRATLRLDPRAARLLAPRRLSLRVIPGLSAEATLSLRGLARRPTGCFEQTTAATFPSAMILALGEAGGATPADLAAARRSGLEGAERLRRFESKAGFSLHPGMLADPWLTAVGLRQLTRLSGVLPIEPERLRRAAAALVAWQESDGAFPLGDFATRRAPEGRWAVSAYACEALAAYLELPLAAEDEEARVALARGVVRLEGRIPSTRANVERAQLARAFLSAERPELAKRLLEGLEAQVRRHEGGGRSYAAEWSLTGSDAEAAAIETTALVAQVLAGLGRREESRPLLLWLAGQRGPGGFGGTQSTVQTLEAFLQHGGTPAEGTLTLALGPELLPPIVVGSDAPTDAPTEIELGRDLADQEALFEAACREGLRLEFRGRGSLHLQLLARGEVPWDTPWGRGGRALAQGAEQLEVALERPLAGRVQQAQVWGIEVRNRGQGWALSPMVHVALPPGFEVTPQGRAGLEGLTRAERLRDWALEGSTLVLYLPDLAPATKAQLTLEVVPTFAGEFAGGALEVYPYYAADAIHVGALPRTIVMSLADSRPVRAAPRPAPAPARAAEPAPRAASAPIPRWEAAPLPGGTPLTIGWDQSALGPLTAEALDLEWGDGPAEQLLARALCAYPGEGATFVANPGGEAQLIPPPRTWGTRIGVSLSDYARAFPEVRTRALAGDLPVVSPATWLGLTADSGGLDSGGSLRWGAAESELQWVSGAPFAARRPETLEAGPLAGGYVCRALEGGGLRLTPRSESGRAVDLIPVDGLSAAQATRFDLLWGHRLPLRAGEAASGGSERPYELSLVFRRLPQSAEVHALRLSTAALGLPERLGGRLGDVPCESVQLALPAQARVLYAQAALRPCAEQIASVLRERGVEASAAPGDRLGQQGDLFLVAAPVGTSLGRLRGSAAGASLTQAHLRSYSSLLVGGRMRPTDALDLNGFLIWPPRVSVPTAATLIDPRLPR